MKSVGRLLAGLALLARGRCDDDSPVTCGSVVKFVHIDTGYYLNSEQKNLNSGSGQQIVTFVKDAATHDTLWWIRPQQHGTDVEYPPTDSTCQLAQPIPCGSTVRLSHMLSMRNLHSHLVSSPLSNQQEVSCYGQGDGKGDNGDNWKVECKAQYWTRNAPFKLWHIDTQKYLGTASNLEFNQQTCGSQCPIMGHLEAFGRSGVDKYSDLKVEQGVHLSK